MEGPDEPCHGFINQNSASGRYIYIYVCQNPKNHDRGMGLWRASLTRLAKSILCVIYGVSTTAYPTLTLKDLPFHGLI